MNAPSPDTCPSAFPPHAVVQVPSLSLSLCLSSPTLVKHSGIRSNRRDSTTAGGGRVSWDPTNAEFLPWGRALTLPRAIFVYQDVVFSFFFPISFFFSNFFLLRISTRRSLDDFLIFRYSRFWIFEFVKFISLGNYGFGNF